MGGRIPAGNAIKVERICFKPSESVLSGETGLSDHERAVGLRTFLSVGALKIEVMDH
jgi:hypothetical protein